MTSFKAFGIRDAIVCAVALSLLIFLFIYPMCFTRSLADDMTSECDALIENIYAGDFTGACDNYNVMRLILEERKSGILILHHHEDVEELEALVAGVGRLASACETSEILSDTERIKMIVIHMAESEKLTIENLL